MHRISRLRGGIAKSVVTLTAAALSWSRYFACAASPSTLYDFEVPDAAGSAVSLREKFGDKRVILVTNVASKCGLTQSNYKGLRELQAEFYDRSFSVVGFPSDYFMNQEFPENEQIQEFANKMGANFPVMGKVDVNGDSADPLFKWLKYQNWGGQPMEAIAWNFAKFLVVDGKVVERYAPTTLPSSIKKDIERALSSVEADDAPRSDL